MKYRVVHYYQTSVVYEIEANSEEEAAEIANGPNAPEPRYETGEEFTDEYIEPMEADTYEN